MKNKLLGMTGEELSNIAVKFGEKRYRGNQIADWIYGHGAKSIVEMTNLPVALCEKLSADYVVGRSVAEAISKGRDHTFKLLLRQSDDERIETVGMAYRDRFSCCVSTQVGCAVGCLFCATGAGGLKRNLLAGEIVDQVLTVQEIAIREKLLTADQSRVSHVVFMGMGEPLLNYDATLKSVKLLNMELGIGMRNLTISTAGYVPGIYRLAKEHLQLTLSVSLHATRDALRKRLMPGMAHYPIRDILTACEDYVRETGRRITFEYCLLENINDSCEHAVELTKLLRKLNCHVNLIPYNDIGDNDFRRPGRERIEEFRRILGEAHIQVTQREQRGGDIHAACGQLRRRLLSLT